MSADLDADRPMHLVSSAKARKQVTTPETDNNLGLAMDVIILSRPGEKKKRERKEEKL